MRLWSIHPSYLDTKALVAVWREGLLALHVLRGQTKGYTNHPQLLRFKKHSKSIDAISAYLHAIVDEAEKRNYAFKREKLPPRSEIEPLSVTLGQLQYETQHLKNKLSVRDKQRFLQHELVEQFGPHPIFKVIAGEIESWEKITKVD